MSDILRGGLYTSGSPATPGELKLQLKRPKAKNTQSIPELVAKFGELKRKILELTQENQSIKEQLIKAHQTNSLLAQENTKLKEKHSEVLDVEATIDESIEELLLAADDVLKGVEEKPVYVSKIPRPVRFSVAKKDLVNEVSEIKAIATVQEVKKPAPTMKTDVKIKSVAQTQPEPTSQPEKTIEVPIQTPEVQVQPVVSTGPKGNDTQKQFVDGIPSPFEVVDLTLVKKVGVGDGIRKDVPLSPNRGTEQSSQTALSSATKPLTSVVSSVLVAEKPAVKMSVEAVARQNSLTAKRMDVFAPKNILEENGALMDATVRKEKVVSTKTKLEAVNDAIIDDIRKYLLVTDALPTDAKKRAIVQFLNLDIMPKQVVAVPIEKTPEPKDEMGVAVMKLAHLTEVEKARLYTDLNMTVDEFYLKNLTSDGVVYL